MTAKIQDQGLPPYIRDRESLPKMNWKTVAALLPLAAAAVFLFGLPALQIMTVTVVAAVAGELTGRLLLKKKTSLYDGHAVLNGFLLAMLLSPSIPVWMAAAGGFFSILIFRELFGGPGHYLFHPVAGTYAFLASSFPLIAHQYVMPLEMTAALPPLLSLKEGASVLSPGFLELFLGLHAGGAGSTAVLAVLLGGIILIWQRLVYWEPPVIFLVLLYGGSYFSDYPPATAVFSGSAVYAAFFLLGDPVTTPHTRSGMRVFAAGAAITTLLIRQYSVHADGVIFALLLMNVFNPWINYFCRPSRLKTRTALP